MKGPTFSICGPTRLRETRTRCSKIINAPCNFIRKRLRLTSILRSRMRSWEDASRWAEKFRAMAPASLVAKFQTGYADFWWKGDTRLLKALVADVPAGTDPDGSVTSVRWDVAMIERDFAGARKILEA